MEKLIAYSNTGDIPSLAFQEHKCPKLTEY